MVDIQPTDELVTFADDESAGGQDVAAEKPAESSAEAPAEPPLGPWRILVVDDEPEIHRLTEFQVMGMRYKERPVQLLNAYSGAMAKEVLAKNPGIAVILLDVVMETEDAGLKLVKYIRDELGLAAARIILRTGQPGAASEKEVVASYDINDYKAKTELTFERMMTCLVSALRSYDGIVTLESAREAERNAYRKAQEQWRDELNQMRGKVEQHRTELVAMARAREADVQRELHVLETGITSIDSNAAHLASRVGDTSELAAIAATTHTLATTAESLGIILDDLLAALRAKS